MLRVFERLNQTYPNLHSSFMPGPELWPAVPHRARPSVAFDADWLEQSGVDRYRVGRVDQGLTITPGDLPVKGDEVVALNGRPMREWKEEAFVFCKFPERGQCESDLYSQLIHEVLSWERTQPLRYSLKRGQRVWTIDVPVHEGSMPGQGGGNPKDLECGSLPNRYPGFTLAYEGNRACVFQSDADTKTAVLRITSFHYRNLSVAQHIQSIDQEITQLLPWWQTHATWEHLLIDVIDNGGGNAPLPYYKILLQNPFQEQYVQFRKSPELQNQALRMSQTGFFWGSNAQELWFQHILSNGVWDATPEYGFLPPIPQFCANDDRDCTEELMQTYPHPFLGRVSVLMNEHCVSSCDGFVWQMRDKLGARVRFFGHPNASDPAYSRLTTHLYLDEGAQHGFRLTVGPHHETLQDPQPWLNQTIYVTRSVTPSGAIIDGHPEKLDGFVPWTIENSAHWTQDVVKAALQR